jgi:hypothetical protein
MFVRRNIKTLDNQMYKDLGFCIKSIAQGQLHRLDTQKLQNRKFHGASSSVDINNQKIGIMWAQAFDGSSTNDVP